MTIRGRIAAADQRLLSRVAAGERPALDQATLSLGRAADHGMLWIAVAAALGARRDKWTRRAALRGLAGMAIASASANLLAKRLVGRTRPDRLLNAAGKRPRTSSFPSGSPRSARVTACWWTWPPRTARRS